MGTWILYFAIYSFVGWLCETIYCSVGSGHFVNRGFLNGTFCPIYGFGALFILSALQPYTDNILLVFFGGMLSTSILEYITSWVMEKVFHNKWWDYSNKKCNIHGRVCLLNSVLFGILSVFMVFVLHPLVVRLVSAIPGWLQWTAAAVLGIYFAVDFIITVKTVLKLNERFERLQQLKLELLERLQAREMDYSLRELLDSVKDSKDELAANIREKIRQLREDNYAAQRRLLKAFPNLQTHKYAEHLADIREVIQNRKKGRD